MQEAAASAPVLDYQLGDAGDASCAKPPRLLPENPTHDDCVKYIQRKWKSRKFRKMFANFPSLEQLRAIYLDPKAEAAGAAGSKWYTSLALAAREHVRMSEEVSQCVKKAWDAIRQSAVRFAEKKVREIGAACESSAEELERSVSAARAALAEGITREAYDVMSQKLYLLSKASDGDGDIDPSDMVETAQEDWEADAGGADVLTREAFERCWFQLIDLHTESLSAEDYAKWSDRTVELITEVVDPETGERGWRGDLDLVNQAYAQAAAEDGVALSAAEQKKFRKMMSRGLLQWGEAFDVGSVAQRAMATSRQQQGHWRGGRGGLGAGRSFVLDADGNPILGKDGKPRCMPPGSAGRGSGLVSSVSSSGAFYAGGSSRGFGASNGNEAGAKVANPFVEPTRQITRGAPPARASSGGSGQLRPAHTLAAAKLAHQFIHVVAAGGGEKPPDASAGGQSAGIRRHVRFRGPRKSYPLSSGTRLGLADSITIYEQLKPTPGSLGTLRPRAPPLAFLRHFSDDPNVTASTVGATAARRRMEKAAALAARRRLLLRGSPSELAMAREWPFDTPPQQRAFGPAARPSTAPGARLWGGGMEGDNGPSTNRIGRAGGRSASSASRSSSASRAAKEEESRYIEAARQLYYGVDFSAGVRRAMRPSASAVELDQREQHVLAMAMGTAEPTATRPRTPAIRPQQLSASAPGGGASARMAGADAYSPGEAALSCDPFHPPPPPYHSPAVSRDVSRPGSATAARESAPLDAGGSSRPSSRPPSRPASARGGRPGSASRSSLREVALPLLEEDNEKSEGGEATAERCAAELAASQPHQPFQTTPQPAHVYCTTPTHQAQTAFPLKATSTFDHVYHLPPSPRTREAAVLAAAAEAAMEAASRPSSAGDATSGSAAADGARRPLVRAPSSDGGLMGGRLGGAGEATSGPQLPHDFLSLMLGRSSSSQALVRAVVGSPFPPSKSMSKLAFIRHGSALSRPALNAGAVHPLAKPMR